MVKLLLFHALKGDSDMCIYTHRYRLEERKRATTIAVAIVGRAKTIETAMEKRSHKQRSKTETRN